MPEVTTQQFTQSLEEALKHYPEPTWLGENSPLASAYFLGELLAPTAITASARGRAVQKLLANATDALTGKYAERYQTILRDYYFQARPAAVVWDQLGLTKNPFHVSRRAAIAALEEILVARLQPALRLEQPPLPVQLVEREATLAHCQALLRKPQTVAVMGPGGIGKTALAAHLVQRVTHPIFWYTLRPGLNDQVESLVFALALFAHRQGSSTLWLELATASQSGQRQPVNERMLSALRYVLGQLDPAPLLCFDEVDGLQPATLATHQAFTHVLESLQGLVPVLLLGQQTPSEANEYVTLSGLSPDGVAQLLLEQPDQAPLTLRREFHTLTQGNPRLLKLCLAALAGGTTVEELQQRLLDSPALDVLFSQTVRLLPVAERQTLMALSVFRSPVPLHHWVTPVTGVAVQRLIAHGFVQPDQAGGGELPLLYRHLVYTNLDEDVRQRLHQQAAALRSSGGAYTAAAYHLVEAGQAEAALALWRERQSQEIAQGQAHTALALFQSVQSMALTSAAQEQSTLICAQLQHLVGQSQTALASLRTVLGKTPILAVEAGDLAGVIANDRNEFASAASAFDRALTIAEQLVEVRMARIYKGRAWMHLRQREIDQAEQELNYAQYEVENMRGNLALDRFSYTQAQTHYQTALELAQALQATEAIGTSCTNLASVALFQGYFATAIDYLQQADAAFSRLGKVAAMAGCRITLAVAHNQAGDHQAALAKLAEAETLLAARGEVQLWQRALIAQAQAEAHLGLGDWAMTAASVQTALATEEISVLPDTYRVAGELALRQGNTAQAEQFLRQSLQLAQTNEDRFLAAYAWRALAQLYQTQHRWTEMHAAQNAAVELFDALNLPNEIARTQALLSEP